VIHAWPSRLGRGGCGVRFSHAEATIVSDDGALVWTGEVLRCQTIEPRRNVPARHIPAV
jgi:hypothetical protein